MIDPPAQIAPNPSPLTIQFCEKVFLNLVQEQHHHKQRHYHHEYHLCFLIIIIIIIYYHYHYHLCLDVPFCKRGCTLSGLHRGRLLAQADDYRWLLMIFDDYWWLLMIVDDYWWLLITDYWWILMIIVFLSLLKKRKGGTKTNLKYLCNVHEKVSVL